MESGIWAERGETTEVTESHKVLFKIELKNFSL